MGYLKPDNRWRIAVMVNVVSEVEGDPTTSFSRATSPSCKEGHYSFLWIAPFTFDPYLIILRV